MRNEFRRIMLPVDFSEYGRRAAQYAAWFARFSKAAVHLVHVVANPADPLYEPEEEAHWVLVEHAQRTATAMLEELATTWLPGLPHEIHVAVGDPYEKIIALARQIKPDLIVMSTHGRGAVAHLAIGSVAEKIVRHAPCPVLVVRREAA